MTPGRTYLDYNATAPLLPEARAAMYAALDLPGNPSSVHAEGRAARAAIEAARGEVAALVGARPQDVVFGSGGSEAVNAVVRSGFDVIVHAGIEHACVGEAAAATGARVSVVPVDASGIIATDALERALVPYHAATSRILVCLQVANNETGVIQPVRALAARAKACGAVVLADAVQACGKIPVDLGDLCVDALAVSAHKIGGPKGVGAVVMAPGWSVAPLVRGGGQERRRRAGTENVAGIAGFGAAAQAARAGLADAARLAALRDRLEREVLAATPDAVIVGALGPRLPNTSCIARRGVAAETQVIRFDLAGIAVSSGAACSSGKVAKSHVLEAMGLGELSGSAIRVSLGWGTTDEDIARFVAAWVQVHAPLAARSVA